MNTDQAARLRKLTAKTVCVAAVGEQEKKLLLEAAMVLSEQGKQILMVPQSSGARIEKPLFCADFCAAQWQEKREEAMLFDAVFVFGDVDFCAAAGDKAVILLKNDIGDAKRAFSSLGAFQKVKTGVMICEQTSSQNAKKLYENFAFAAKTIGAETFYAGQIFDGMSEQQMIHVFCEHFFGTEVSEV